MRKFLLSVGISLLLAQGAFAAEPHSILRPGHPDKYIVKKGDTLWDIASTFLTDAWMWPEIWHINPDIKNPDLIYPGDTIILSFVNGKPRLSVQRGEASRTVKLTPEASTSSTSSAANGTIKLEPRVRESPLTSSIPAIPLDAIAGLLKKGRIVQPGTLRKAPHIVAGTIDRLIFAPGDDFFAKGNWKGATSVYGIYRKGQTFVDPETHKVLGYEAKEVGTASVKSRDGKVVRFSLDTVNEDVRLGDRLLPTAERKVETTFYPSAPKGDVSGQVMTIIGDNSLAGRFDVVALNRGEAQGLVVGNVLALYKHSKIVRDPVDHRKVQLPPERVGLAMIFRTFEKMSYALILNTDDPIAVGDVVRNP